VGLRRPLRKALAMELLAALITVAIAGYLVVALLAPERFQ
jgi:K+-transporting ATPase KdpF subunit